MTFAFVFPGQGSQIIGMGRDFYDNFNTAREVFSEVDEALSQNLTKLIFEGNPQELTLTENAQPALMTVSMAIIRTIEHQMGYPIDRVVKVVAGHSLGEYTAHCAARTFSLSDTARLLKLRGQAMQQAAPVGQGAMAAILGLEIEDVELLARDSAQGEVCVIANDNSPGQIVISGHKNAIDRAIALAGERGAKRALALPVSAPFHSPLMEPAAHVMAKALEETRKESPSVPILANVTTTVSQDCKELTALLVDQVTGRVRWRESMATLRTLGVSQAIEVGAGKVLTGLMKRIDPEIHSMAINTPQEMDSFLKNLV